MLSDVLAGMAELAYADASKASVPRDMRVRVPLPAPSLSYSNTHHPRSGSIAQRQSDHQGRSPQGGRPCVVPGSCSGRSRHWHPYFRKGPVRDHGTVPVDLEHSYDLPPGGVTMPHRKPAVRSRELGDGLRQSREQAGLTGTQAAQALCVSPSFVSMLLSGKCGTSELDIATFLGVCRSSLPHPLTPRHAGTEQRQASMWLLRSGKDSDKHPCGCFQLQPPDQLPDLDVHDGRQLSVNSEPNTTRSSNRGAAVRVHRTVIGSRYPREANLGYTAPHGHR